MSERGWGGWIRFGLPGMALGLALAWGTGGRGPEVLAAQGSGAQTPPSLAPNAVRPAGVSGESSGTIALTTPAGNSGQLLYLIDTRTKAFAVYRIDSTSGKGMVKLEAARQYQWDLKLSEYNNQPPEVTAIESTVRSLGQQQPNR